MGRDEEAYRELIPIDALLAEARKAAAAVVVDEHPYRASAQAAEAVDAALLEASARPLFKAWASELPGVTDDPVSHLRSAAARTQLVGRLSTRLDGRHFVWRSAPYAGRDEATGAALDPASLDPRRPPHDLRARSRYLGLCKTCSGNGRVTCRSCQGDARVTCKACGGAGKVHGVTANGARRLLNCKICKGKGDLVCDACSRGKLACEPCKSSGRIEHWLEVEGGPRALDVQLSPAIAVRAFPWGQRELLRSNEELGEAIAKDATLVCSVSRERLLDRRDLPVEVPSAWCDEHWDKIQAKLQPGEHVISQSFALVSVPSVEVEYRVGAHQQLISFEGRRLLAPPASVDRPFRARASALKTWAWSFAAVPLLIFIVYLARGSYFHNSELAGLIGCVAIAAALGFEAIRRGGLGRPRRRVLATLLVPALGAGALMWHLEPSLDAARAHLAAGRLDLARTELAALRGDDAEVAEVLAEVALREALTTASCGDATAKLAAFEGHPAQRARAVQHADQLALRDAAAALVEGKPDRARLALGCASAEQRAAPNARVLQRKIAAALGRACVGASDWACVLTEAHEAGAQGDLEEQKALLAALRAGVRKEIEALAAAARAEQEPRTRRERNWAAVALWEKFLVEDAASDARGLAALKEAIAKDDAIIARLDAAEAKRLAEQRAREERAERQRQLAAEREAARLARAERQRELAAERAERQREARESSRLLLCNDGTYSPTCTCGRSSYRGCCSWHGGVDGSNCN